VKYKGKNIDDVLNMTVNMAWSSSRISLPSTRNSVPSRRSASATSRSDSPAPRSRAARASASKLSSELSKRDTGRTLYILDEPTTGLHFEDIRLLLDVLNKLVDRGNTVIVVEHNLDVIKVADHIIDIGPEGGAAGGEIVAAGTPHEIACAPRSYTGEFLKKLGL